VWLFTAAKRGNYTLRIKIKSLVWDDEKVNIIFMVCISKKNLSKERQIFTYFNELLESDELLAKILNCNNRSKIKQILLDCSSQ